MNTNIKSNKDLIINSLINGINELEQITDEQKEAIKFGLNLLNLHRDVTDDEFFEFQTICHDSYFETTPVEDCIKLVKTSNYKS